MLNDELVERLIIAIGNHLPGLRFIESSRLLHQFQKRAAAVVEMREPMFHLGGAKWMHIKADIFTVAAVFILLQDPHLIECAAEDLCSRRVCLVEFLNRSGSVQVQ